MWALSFMLGCSPALRCVVDQVDAGAALLETPSGAFVVVHTSQLSGPPAEGDAIPCDDLLQGAEPVAIQGASRRPTSRALAHMQQKEGRE